MTKQQLEKKRAEICAEIKKLNESITYLEGATQPIEPSEAIGRVTRMEAIGEKSVNESMLRDAVNRLERLKNALLRIDDGTYGVCVRCKRDIPAGRLEAVPEALVCVPCAEKKKR